MSNIIGLFGKSGLAELSLSEGGTSIRILRDGPGGAAAPVPVAPATSPGTQTIPSPLFGIAHRAPNPGAAPFIDVGSTVEIGQTICVIEAMKVFNLIAADRAGTVTRILFDDGAEVEADQPLVEIA